MLRRTADRCLCEHSEFLNDRNGGHKDRAIIFHGKRRHRNRTGTWGGWLWECRSDYDVYWNTQDPNWAVAFFAEVRPRGSDENGISADPKFVDWENGDFRLTPAAAAHQVGFKEIDVNVCGLTGRQGRQPNASDRSVAD
jgi:hypothetical protein